VNTAPAFQTFDFKSEIFCKNISTILVNFGSSLMRYGSEFKMLKPTALKKSPFDMSMIALLSWAKSYKTFYVHYFQIIGTS
jgi:hypothetical protein